MLILTINDADMEQRLIAECLRRQDRGSDETARTLLLESLERIKQTRSELGDIEPAMSLATAEVAEIR